METRCALLVATCDARRDVLGPTLASLRKHWPEKLAPIRIVSETAEELGPEAIPVGTGIWCRQIGAALSRVEVERAILWLDDFILRKPVDPYRLGRAIELSRSFSCLRISRMPIPGGGERTAETIEHAPGWPSRIAFQPSIFDPSFLAGLVAPSDTPWEVEANQVALDEKFPTGIHALSDPIVQYKETTIRNRWTPIGLRLARRFAKIPNVTREVGR